MLHITSTFSTRSCSSRGFSPILKPNLYNPISIISPNSRISSCIIAIPHGMQSQDSAVYARKKRRSTGRSTKLILQLASLVVANLKILPPPLDLFIAELSGGDGNGGGVGLWRGFSGGGFDGWIRKRMKPLLFFACFLLICGLGLLFLTELKIDVICGFFGFVLFSVALIQLWQKRGITKDFVWGSSILGILVAMGLRRFEAQKSIKKICNPMMKTLKKAIYKL